MENAHLLEAAVRNLAMFSAQTREAQRAASEIRLVKDPKDNLPVYTPPPEPSEIVMPPGVRDPREGPPPPPKGVEVHGTKAELTPEELPDDEDRKVVPDVPAEDKNKAGSFERFLTFSGQMKTDR